MRPYLIPGETCKVSLPDQDSNPRLWNGFEFGNPMKNFTLFEDFNDTISAWDTTVVGAGTVALSTVDESGALLLTNTAADDDSILLQKVTTVQPLDGRNIWFEARVKASDVTQSDFVVGLVETTVTPLTPNNGIFFKKDDGDAFLDFSSIKAGAISTESNISTLTDNLLVDIGFKVTGTSLVEFYVYGRKVGEYNGAVPIVTLRPTVFIQNGEAVAKVMTIDCIMVAQTRRGL